MRGRHLPRRDVTGANLVLSFIDVLASALGAAVLLFVILASSPISVPGKAQAAGGFIRYEWTVSDLDALMRLVLSRDGGDSQYIDLDQLEGDAVRTAGLGGVASYALIGFADAVAENSKTSSERTYILQLNRPTAGSWQVGILYFDRNGSENDSPTAEVTTHVTTDSKARCKELMLEQITSRGMVSPHPIADKVSLNVGDFLYAPRVIAADEATAAVADGKKCF